MKIVYENGPVRVVEENKERGLFVDGACQGRARVDSGGITPISTYMVAIEALIAKLVGRKALVIGAGACMIPSMLVKAGFRVDIVEPNQEMFDVAQKYFNYEPHGLHILSTGEDYLGEYFERYDVIVLDAFNGLGRVRDLCNARTYKQLTDMSNKLFINHIALSSEEIMMHIGMLDAMKFQVKKHVIHNKTPFQAVLECTNEEP